MSVDEYTKEGLKLDALIEYQGGAIVSKTLINKGTGTVTLFAFDKGESLSEHTAPFDAIVNILEGGAKITIDGKPYNLKSGEMIIMPGGKPHALQAVEKFKMMLIMIKGS
jgi:quercetin dioxygenase-like cupin family protein